MMKPKYLYWGLPLLGILFCLWYVKQATCDVIYSDYVRLVNSYLPDIYNPDKFFVPDLLTRVPVNYLGRIINVELFGFSLTFDRVLGVLGLGASALVCGFYSLKHRIGRVWFLCLMVILFGLNKWEMLTNGSGWSHFLAFAAFYYHYLVIDRVYRGEGGKREHILLIILPFVITLGLSGPYCAIYSVTVILAYGFILLQDMIKKKKMNPRYLCYGFCTVIPLILYMISNSYAVEDHAGAVSEPLLPALMNKTSFFFRFFFKSLASMVMGDELLRDVVLKGVPHADTVMILLGVLVAGAYLLALWMNFRYKLYQKTIFPLMLIAAGGLNHVLILVSRWIFINENYGMSSRYALQFQVGILGILLTFALLWNKLGHEKKTVQRVLVAALSLMFLCGNGYTTYKEYQKAPYREHNFETIAAIAVDFENQTDEALLDVFEYRKNEEGSADKIRTALTILKENGWNIFMEESGTVNEEAYQ